eukprot:6272791-Lingulodinium_polyedra.AAC.1
MCLEQTGDRRRATPHRGSPPTRSGRGCAVAAGLPARRRVGHRRGSRRRARLDPLVEAAGPAGHG